MNKTSGAFSQEDSQLLEYMGGHIAQLLLQAKLSEQQSHAHRTTAAVLQVLQLVAHDDDIQTLVSSVVQAAKSLLHADRVSLFLVDHIQRELWTDVRGCSCASALCY